MALYGQDAFLRGDAHQVAAWLSSTNPDSLTELAGLIRERRDNDLHLERSHVDSWVRDCSRRRRGEDDRPCSHLPHDPPDTDTRPGDGYKPPQVGAKDHKTVRDRLQYQQRGYHLPYVRSASYDEKVPSNKWTRATIKAYDDPYKLTSGSGVVLNQDGLWTFIVKTDWSVGHAEVVSGASQATRFMVNGADVGIRDYLDDDAYSATLPINTLTWTDEFRAGTTINIDVRSEGLGDGYTAVCNVYFRAFLVRCYDGAFDMKGFPLPADPKPPQQPPNPPHNPRPPSCPNPPLHGNCQDNPRLPTTSFPNSNSCYEIGYENNGYVINEAGIVGQIRCINSAMTTVYSDFGWDNGQHFSGGTVSSGGSVVDRLRYSGGF
jgi:hypothetical protein